MVIQMLTKNSLGRIFILIWMGSFWVFPGTSLADANEKLGMINIQQVEAERAISQKPLIDTTDFYVENNLQTGDFIQPDLFTAVSGGDFRLNLGDIRKNREFDQGIRGPGVDLFFAHTLDTGRIEPGSEEKAGVLLQIQESQGSIFKQLNFLFNR